MGRSRSEIIECLCDIKTDAVYQLLSEEKEAIDYAISSLKTDEAYQIMYEGGEIFTKDEVEAMLKELFEQMRQKHEYYFNLEDYDTCYGISISMDCLREKYVALEGGKDGTMGTNSSALQHSSD